MLLSASPSLFRPGTGTIPSSAGFKGGNCPGPSARGHPHQMAPQTNFIKKRNIYVEEIIQFAAFAKLRSCLTPSQQPILLQDEGLADTFSGVNVLLRICLSMMVTSCLRQWPFSNLALIKKNLRTTMTHKD